MRESYHDAAKRRRLERFVSWETSRWSLFVRLQPRPILVALGPGRQAALAREDGNCSWQKCTAQEMPLILGFVAELKVLNRTLAPANT